MKTEQKVAKYIGNSFAYIQSKVDNGVDYIFNRLSKSGNKVIPENTHPIKKFGYRTIGFFGDIGSNFYKRYSEIKKEEEVRKEKN